MTIFKGEAPERVMLIDPDKYQAKVLRRIPTSDLKGLAKSYRGTPKGLPSGNRRVTCRTTIIRAYSDVALEWLGDTLLCIGVLCIPYYSAKKGIGGVRSTGVAGYGRSYALCTV